MKKIKGIIKKVYYASPKWSATLIEITEPKSMKGRTIKASGSISMACENIVLEITDGKMEVDPKYGEYIDVKESSFSVEPNEEWIKSYLSSLSGISIAYADKIWNMFGENSISVLNKTPKEYLKISGIGERKLNKIIKSHEEKGVCIDIIRISNGKISMNQAIKIRDHYKNKSVQILENNPYDLIYHISGFGFSTVDAIAESVGIEKKSEERITAAMIHVLKTLSEKDGHCYCTTDILQNLTLDLLSPIPKTETAKLSKKSNKSAFEHELRDILNSVSIKAFSDQEYNEKINNVASNFALNKDQIKKIQNWIDESVVYIDIISQCLYNEISKKQNNNRKNKDDEGPRLICEIAENEDRIYWTKLYEAETNIARCVSRMVKLPSVKNIDLNTIQSKIIDTERDLGYSLGLEQKEAIKTALSNRLAIITGGPGRGKTTIIKTILDIWGDDSKVILCAPTGRASQRMAESTGRNASTIHRKMLIPHQQESVKDCLIIIDESSMLDLLLAEKIFKYAYNCNLVFVGDVDQLPSIGAGSFFRDLINCKMVPTVVLKHGYRNEGSIAQNSEKINDGESLKNMKIDDFFSFCESPSESVQNDILSVYDKLLEKYAIKDISILSPMRKRSKSGTEIINSMIRDHINPLKSKDDLTEDGRFRLNDRVMCTYNNFSKELTKNKYSDEKASGVFNGDCGEIIEICDNGTVIEFDDGRTGLFQKNELADFELAYAITIHKSQGSEYPAVIIPFNTEHFVMLQRNLLYTAVTRAKKEVYIIGDKKAFNMAVRNTDYKYRNSMLKERIIDAVKAHMC